MAASALAESQWARISALVAERLGLDYPPVRWKELQRGVAEMAEELRLPNLAAGMDLLLSGHVSEAHLRVLASYVTVGETYFMRERKGLEAFTHGILPELIRSRAGPARGLRIWSAACCTGEEPYTLSILLQETVPNLQKWATTILATDINARFLKKAAAGIYSEWSFRDTREGFKERYFTRSGKSRYAVRPEIKERVTFRQFNLVDPIVPPQATDLGGMDVIFCRNVLMYFTPSQARKAVHRLHAALADGGWLVVGPAEGPQGLFSEFEAVSLAGALVYRKRAVLAAVPVASQEKLTATLTEAEATCQMPTALGVDRTVEASTSPSTLAASLFAQGRYIETAEMLLESPQHEGRLVSADMALLVRALANQAKLTDALSWCGRWLAADKLNPSAHYLRAVILQELGDSAEARVALQRALYVDPGFVLAHFALGNLARDDGRADATEKHFANALELLRRCAPDEPLPEADGLTAARLIDIIHSITNLETAL
jgi:chemotaxis protein methyltransferase CheR